MFSLCVHYAVQLHSSSRTMKSRSFSRPWLQLKNVSCCLMIVPSDWLSWTAFSANCVGSLTFALISTLDGMALLSMCRTQVVQVVKTGVFIFLNKLNSGKIQVKTEQLSVFLSIIHLSPGLHRNSKIKTIKT